MNDETTMKIGAVLFDLDYTLWDHGRAQEKAIHTLCDSYSIDFQAFYPHYVRFNWEVWSDYARGKLSLEKMRIVRFEKAFRAIGASECSPDLWSREYLVLYRKSIFLVEGAVEILRILKPRYTIGIITNGTLDTQTFKVNQSPLRDYLDFMVTVDDAGCSKPERAFFEKAFLTAGFPREKIACVGDHYHEDIVGAKKAGAGTVVWFNPGGEQLPDNAEILPDYIISRLEELPPRLC